MRRIAPFLTLILLFTARTAGAQEMADALRASGKIYVVVLVMATIFAGIIAFLIFMERRLSRLEKHSNSSL